MCLHFDRCGETITLIIGQKVRVPAVDTLVLFDRDLFLNGHRLLVSEIGYAVIDSSERLHVHKAFFIEAEHHTALQGRRLKNEHMKPSLRGHISNRLKHVYAYLSLLLPLLFWNDRLQLKHLLHLILRDDSISPVLYIPLVFCIVVHLIITFTALCAV